MSEVWAPIKGYEGIFEVSDLGRVRSLFRGPRILATHLSRDGYPCITLRGKNYRVHTLVCTAFHGPCPEGYECGHRNGDRNDPRAENLRWITQSENQRDALRHGSHVVLRWSGENHPRARLSDETILALRADAAAGMGGRRLARKYGINRSYAHELVTGRKRQLPKQDALTLSPISPSSP